MIPTLLLVGLVAGTVARPKVAAATGVVVAVVWGVLIGVANRDPTTFAAGTGLALANIAVGLSLGVPLHFLLSRMWSTAR